jgi:hypothetical protein
MPRMTRRRPRLRFQEELGLSISNIQPVAQGFALHGLDGPGGRVQAGAEALRLDGSSSCAFHGEALPPPRRRRSLSGPGRSGLAFVPPLLSFGTSPSGSPQDRASGGQGDFPTGFLLPLPKRQTLSADPVCNRCRQGQLIFAIPSDRAPVMTRRLPGRNSSHIAWPNRNRKGVLEDFLKAKSLRVVLDCHPGRSQREAGPNLHLVQVDEWVPDSASRFRDDSRAASQMFKEKAPALSSRRKNHVAGAPPTGGI